MAGGREARTENPMRVDPARQQMRRTGMLSDSMVNIVQDIARDTSRWLVGFEDCWTHAHSTPFYTFSECNVQRYIESTLQSRWSFFVIIVSKLSGALES